MLNERLWILLFFYFAKAAKLPDNWAYQVTLGESVTLHCNDSYYQVMETDTVEWTLPNDKKLQTGVNDDNYQLVTDNNVADLTLTVKGVQTGNEGIYQCVIYRNGEKYSELIRGINLSGPKYKEMIVKYEPHIIVAFVAMAVFFVPLVGACFVYRFRFITDEELMKKQAKKDAKHLRELNGDTAMVEITEKQAAVDFPEKQTAAYSVAAKEGGGAYDNPDSGFSTQL